MHEEQVDLNEFGMWTRGVVEQIGEGFTDHDEDWFPVMVIMPGDKSKPVVTAFDPAYLETSHTKEILATQVMPAMINGFGGKAISMVQSVWILKLDHLPEEEANEIYERVQREGLANEPNRVEQVMVISVNSHDIDVWGAEIDRDGTNPPRLGEWEHMESGDWSGRFVEPIQAALRDSSGRRSHKRA
jgi:hypothetical protein